MGKTLEHYKRLPYTLYVEPMRDSDGSDYWVAEYRELRGCKTDGATEAEAIANVQDLFDEYISMRIETGLEIPEPTQLPFVVRELPIVLSPQKPVSSLPLDAGDTHETRAKEIYEEFEMA
jgi:predicted RNase H-like HicB family nuclease